MLLTELILSKKGPLAKVWISAHQERKLSKAQTLQVDVGETVGEWSPDLSGGRAWRMPDEPADVIRLSTLLYRGYPGTRW